MTLAPVLARLSGRVGLWTMTLDALAPARAAEVAGEIDELGYGALWVPEAWGREAFTHAGLLLGATERLVVATGIANIWARDAVSATNAARTLVAASNDRFVLGLGVSHQPLVERLRGHEYRRPLAAMRAYLAAMDAAPMLAHEVDAPVNRVLAALGPKMLELAASAADGAHPYLVTPEYVARVRAALGTKFVGVEQAVVLDESREEYLRRAHDHLETYTGLPNYRESWRRQGFHESDWVRGGSERLCDAMVVHGDEAAIYRRVADHLAAGADHVCLQVLGESVTATPLAEWRRLAPGHVGAAR